MDISFIIVNYKSAHLLSACIASIQKNSLDLLTETIIINNDDVALSLNLPKVTVLNQADNLGFAKACNIGARAATGKFIFFLNPDAELLTSNLDVLIDTLGQEDVAIVAPNLLNTENKSQQWSAGSDITPLEILKNNLGIVSSKKIWTSSVPTEAEWVSGAAFMLSKKLFLEIDGFDEHFFMYFEDVDLCRRFRTAGKKIILLPSVKVRHLSGKSRTSHSSQKAQYYFSQNYYLKKHFSPTKALAIHCLKKVVLFLRTYSFFK